MTSNDFFSRREHLKFLVSIPALPYALQEAHALSPQKYFRSRLVPKAVSFTGTELPKSVEDKAKIFTTASIDIEYEGSEIKRAQPLTFRTLFRTGDQLPHPVSGVAFRVGGYYRPDGVTPIVDVSGAEAEQFFSDCPDGLSVLPHPAAEKAEKRSKTAMMVVQFEYKTANKAGQAMYGLLPSQIGILQLKQNGTTGELLPLSYFNVPTNHVHGLWICCASSISPWQTHLASEEYEPDAWQIDNEIPGKVLTQFRTFSQNTFGDARHAKPYHYGHVPEVMLNADGTGQIKKHYAMGRISRELVEVMPDQRTVLMGDDANNGGLFMYMADRPGDLSVGTLYAAKIKQTSAAGATDGGQFVISWIRLGHARSQDIEAMADTLTANDILDVKTTNPMDGQYRKINFDNKHQWVKIHSGMEQAAAFLETHRYAAWIGATMELSKFEGVALNQKNKVAYFAMSSIRDAMTSRPGFSDEIQLKAVQAGGIYEVTLISDPAIGSDWVPREMYVPTALLGLDLIEPDQDGNAADLQRIANPDNLKFSESLRTLFIGEDSGMHLNNAVWAYEVDTKKLSRLLTVPAGAECVSLCPVDDLNGFAYLFAGFQHPGDWKFKATQSELKTQVKAHWQNNQQAAIGYLDGLPCLR